MTSSQVPASTHGPTAVPIRDPPCAKTRANSAISPKNSTSPSHPDDHSYSTPTHPPAPHRGEHPRPATVNDKKSSSGHRRHLTHKSPKVPPDLGQIGMCEEVGPCQA